MYGRLGIVTIPHDSGGIKLGLQEVNGFLTSIQIIADAAGAHHVKRQTQPEVRENIRLKVVPLRIPNVQARRVSIMNTVVPRYSDRSKSDTSKLPHSPHFQSIPGTVLLLG